ncbi:hypothetical protein [Paenibacillus woosongensis]|uniref:Uncharacterized protein n=1 Tax=Paenibacillus woosongensis TaxID=307580 RepID=A0A7X2YYZ7_9BACL|nr:hypothetical protein [Paenibacillus woosongensis]MUG44544.1 hypothetical protein [Paenibacillus woosongensis]
MHCNTASWRVVARENFAASSLMHGEASGDAVHERSRAVVVHDRCDESFAVI